MEKVSASMKTLQWITWYEVISSIRTFLLIGALYFQPFVVFVCKCPL